MIDTLRDMLKYSKHIREVVAGKRKHVEFEIVALIDECSFREMTKLPKTLKDHESFTLSTYIGDDVVRNELYDLGETIN